MSDVPIRAARERERAVIHFRTDASLDDEFRSLVDSLEENLTDHYANALRAYLPELRKRTADRKRTASRKPQGTRDKRR